MPKTVAEVLQHLRPSDCRREFWIKMAELIAHGQYDDAWNKVKGNKGDSDYDEQKMIVAKSIELDKENR
jgi:hypothetical protein